MKYIILLIVMSLLAGCTPRDEKTDSFKNRIERGEVVTLDTRGQRSPSCNSKKPSWADLRFPWRDYQSVVAGARKFVVRRGSYNCLEVGSVVSIGEYDKPLDGRAIITKIIFVKLSKVEKIGAFGLEKYGLTFSSYGFEKRVESLKKGMKSHHHGVVNAVFFKYLSGTSETEQIVQKMMSSNDDHLVGKIEKVSTKTKYKTLIGCKKTYHDMLIQKKYYKAIFQGRAKSIITMGGRNCVQAGSTVNLKERLGKEFPVFGQLRIKSVTKMVPRTLKESHIKESARMIVEGKSFESLRNFAIKDITSYNSNKLKKQSSPNEFYRYDPYMTITEFEYIRGSFKGESQFIGAELEKEVEFKNQDIVVAGKRLSECMGQPFIENVIKIQGYYSASLLSAKMKVIIQPHFSCVTPQSQVELIDVDQNFNYGTVEVDKVSLRHWSDLDQMQNLAKLSGVTHMAQLKSRLKRDYGDISKKPISIIYIKSE